MSLESFPQTLEYQQLNGELARCVEKKSREAGKKPLKEPPRLICKGMTCTRTEFVIGDGIIQSCLRQIPGDVTVFGMNGKTQAFRVTKHTSGSGYVFAGNLIGIITNVNENIELWGYPDQKLSVFVLSVGVSSQ